MSRGDENREAEGFPVLPLGTERTVPIVPDRSPLLLEWEMI